MEKQSLNRRLSPTRIALSSLSLLLLIVVFHGQALGQVNSPRYDSCRSYVNNVKTRLAAKYRVVQRDGAKWFLVKRKGYGVPMYIPTDFEPAFAYYIEHDAYKDGRKRILEPNPMAEHKSETCLKLMHASRELHELPLHAPRLILAGIRPVPQVLPDASTAEVFMARSNVPDGLPDFYVSSAPRLPTPNTKTGRRRFWAVTSVLFGSTILDAESTVAGLQRGCSEANPLLGPNPTRFRMYSMSLAADAADALITYYFNKKHRNKKTTELRTMSPAIAVHTAAALHNLGLNCH